jgi:hypothetical protein
MSPAYTWIYTASSLLHSSLLVVMFVVVAIGWLRHRRVGFLVLTAWTVVALFNIFGSWIWSSLAKGTPWIQKIFSSVPPHLLVAVPSMVASFLSMVLLLAGLALLVFRAAPTSEGVSK